VASARISFGINLREGRRVIRWIGIIVVALVIGISGVALAARFSDGPIGIIAGGPLVAGELVNGTEPDWSFAHDIDTVEFQLLSPPRSRTTWILEHAGKIYIPCGYMTSTVGRLWKHWPIEAEQDGSAILRIAGKRYPRELVRIQSGALLEPLTQEMQRKYGAPATPATVESGSLWLFELAPPPAES
jgi:hypothetical protein